MKNEDVLDGECVREMSNALSDRCDGGGDGIVQ